MQKQIHYIYWYLVEMNHNPVEIEYIEAMLIPKIIMVADIMLFDVDQQMYCKPIFD